MNAILCTKEQRGRKPCDEGLRGAAVALQAAWPPCSVHWLVTCHQTSTCLTSAPSPPIPLGAGAQADEAALTGPLSAWVWGLHHPSLLPKWRGSARPPQPPPASTTGPANCCSHLGEPSTRIKKTLPFIPLLKHKTKYTN